MKENKNWQNLSTKTFFGFDRFVKHIPSHNKKIYQSFNNLKSLSFQNTCQIHSQKYIYFSLFNIFIFNAHLFDLFYPSILH